MIEPYGNRNHVKAADYALSVLNELLCTDDYVLQCINCHAKQDLVMTAHRIDGYLVG